MVNDNLTNRRKRTPTKANSRKKDDPGIELGWRQRDVILPPYGPSMEDKMVDRGNEVVRKNLRGKQRGPRVVDETKPKPPEWDHGLNRMVTWKG